MDSFGSNCVNHAVLTLVKQKISKEIFATIIYMYKEKYEEGWWPKIESDPSQG